MFYTFLYKTWINRFYFKISSIVNIFCKLRVEFLVPFNNLMSRLLANTLNFNSIFSYFVTAFIFSILFNLFILSILSSSIFLFVVSFIDSILILYHSILLSFLFCLFLFLFLVLLINFIPTPFFHCCFL